LAVRVSNVALLEIFLEVVLMKVCRLL